MEKRSRPRRRVEFARWRKPPHRLIVGTFLEEGGDFWKNARGNAFEGRSRDSQQKHGRDDSSHPLRVSILLVKKKATVRKSAKKKGPRTGDHTG